MVCSSNLVLSDLPTESICIKSLKRNSEKLSWSQTKALKMSKLESSWNYQRQSSETQRQGLFATLLDDDDDDGELLPTLEKNTQKDGKDNEIEEIKIVNHVTKPVNSNIDNVFLDNTLRNTIAIPNMMNHQPTHYNNPTSILQKLPQSYNNHSSNNNIPSPKKVVRFQETESDIQILNDNRSEFNNRVPPYNAPLQSKQHIDLSGVYNTPLPKVTHIDMNSVFNAPIISKPVITNSLIITPITTAPLVLNSGYQAPLTSAPQVDKKNVFNAPLSSAPQVNKKNVYNAPLPSAPHVEKNNVPIAPRPSAPHVDKNYVHIAPKPSAPQANNNVYIPPLSSAPLVIKNNVYTAPLTNAPIVDKSIAHNSPLLNAMLSDPTNQTAKNQLADHVRHRRISEAIEAAIASPANRLPQTTANYKVPNTVMSNWSISQKLDHRTHEIMPLKLKLKKNPKIKGRNKQKSLTDCRNSQADGVKKKPKSKSNKKEKEISFLDLPEDGNYLIVRKIIEECPMCYTKLNIRNCSVHLKLLLYTYYCQCGLTIFHIPNTPDNIPHPIKIIET